MEQEGMVRQMKSSALNSNELKQCDATSGVRVPVRSYFPLRFLCLRRVELSRMVERGVRVERDQHLRRVLRVRLLYAHDGGHLAHLHLSRVEHGDDRSRG